MMNAELKLLWQGRLYTWFAPSYNTNRVQKRLLKTLQGQHLASTNSLEGRRDVVVSGQSRAD